MYPPTPIPFRNMLQKGQLDASVDNFDEGP